MPNTKISALTSATTPLAGTEVLPVVQSSTTTQVSVENLTAGRAVSALNLSVTGATIPTNGIYLSATNSLGTATNGTLRSTYDASGNFSVGTLSATGRITAGALRTTSSGEFLGGINALDTTTGGAAGVGGVITFSGDTQGAGYKQFSAVLGGKQNSTLTDFAGYLAFYTRPGGGNLTERGRFNADGSFNVIGTISSNSVAVPTISSTSTLTNKRVTPRVSTTTSSATPTINTDNVDVYGLTAQAVDITSFSTNLSGTPTDGQLLRIYIVGTAARAITWGASFEPSTTPLPTTTVTTNRLDVGFVWNAATSKWRCLASA